MFLIKMKLLVTVLCLISRNLVEGLSSEETLELTETCCTHGQYEAVPMTSSKACSGVSTPDDVEPELTEACLKAAKDCCEQHFIEKDDCAIGIKLSRKKQCGLPKTDIGKTCCDECSFGRWSGESQGIDACGSAAEEGMSPQTTLRKNAFHKCCLEAAQQTTTETTTTEKKIETTTERKKEEKKEKCKKDSCQHICKDGDGKVKCACRKGFRLEADNKTCKDINECGELTEDLCTEEDTVCHNTEGSYKCVPIKKRDVSLSCPPGFKRNLLNQVCDDINECQLPRPPCPKYLCENTIGGYKCAGKAGKPFEEAIPGHTTEVAATTPTVKNDICPPGFRAGPDDECLDIDECEERLDDCQRLSQHCINTHGNYFCQDHVSKRCAPGFKVNAVTGICEDIDECEESSEVCRRSEVCVNLPGAYNCKSKISTLPQLTRKTCQEGTRQRPGGKICEDIDECREGSHLCDHFQNCINTFGGHECRCKNGFELDSSSGSCVDIDECALKLDNCQGGLHCLNVLGSFTCTRRAATTSTTRSTTSTTTLAPPAAYDYEYYDSEEDNTTNVDKIPEPSLPVSKPTTTTSTTTTTTTTTSTTTPRPTTTSTTSTTTTPATTSTTTTARTTRVRPWPGYNPYYPRHLIPTTRRNPYTIPDRPEHRRPEFRPRRPEVPSTPVEVTVPAPTNVDTIEKEKEPDGSYGLNTNDLPKDKWTNVIGTYKPDQPDFSLENLHCLNGFEKSPSGECVDINECETAKHICSSLEVCHNSHGGYTCECMPGFRRDATGWCVVITTTSTTTTTTTTTPKPTTVRTTTSTTEMTTTSTEAPRPPRPRVPWYAPPMSCDFGYAFSPAIGKCIDIDECASNKANCAPKEDCVNTDGGYRCVCGKRCRGETDTPAYYPTPREPSVLPDTNVITVGAQFGQRGSRVMRPTYTRASSGSVLTSCPWGYKLTPDKRCVDIDECARNVSECGPQQRCENFYGGYSCQCPAGHRLVGQQRCEDIDECAYGNPCSYNAQCINTIGSYRCSCGEGFRNAPTNDKVCVDVDECAESPGVCAQGCANAWGGYRCYCERGYRLHIDNRTCVDVDECAEWGSSRVRGRLCGGRCVNVPGTYRCSCPHGYRLSDDARSCIDIDECETGEAQCARGSDAGMVCQNTRGGYHCHHIDCPPGYRLESKHKCTRIQRSCSVTDWACIRQPSAISYNFITFVSNIFLPAGSVDLFTMHGPSWRDSVVSFEMRVVDVQAPSGVKSADLSCFDMRPTGNVCVVSLLCALGGPQVAELELAMSLYQRGQFAGSALARLVVIVSEYEF
ncbi:PREDICTED: fibulin-1 [Papilio polytes]|uniref:fibulin-1 n=1 Tax=Papilio polytes TaxID=76194 RepID=UPI0006765B72|nr:PREDICTED: fibulin-1 [Papilio polytes]